MLFKQENLAKTLFVFFGFFATAILAVISYSVLDVYSSVDIVVDLTSVNSYTDTENTTGIWKTNYLGGAHAARRWASLGGGSTSTDAIMVTSTIWQTSRNGYAHFGVDGSDNIYLASLDFPDASTYRISASKFSAADKRWKAFSNSDASEVLFVTSTAISYSLQLILDQNSDPAIYFIDTGASANLYYTKWNSNTNQWEDVSGNPGTTNAIIGHDSSYAVGASGFVAAYDANNNAVISYSQASSTYTDIKIAKWNGSQFVGLLNPSEPDSLAYVGGLSGKALLWPNIRFDQNNRAYLFFVEDVPASSYEKAHIIKFDGSQWVNPVTNLSGYYQYINPPAYFSYHGTRAAAVSSYGSDIYFGLRIWPSSSEARSLYVTKLSQDSFYALDGSAGVTSTAGLITTPLTTNNAIDAVEVLSSGVVGVRYSGTGVYNKNSFYQYWDPAASVWRSFTGARDGVSESDVLANGLSIANGLNSGIVKFDSNGLPVILTRAKDPNDATHDAIYMARGLYVTSTPSILQTTNLLTQTSEEYVKATASYSGDLNGGAVSIQLSADQGASWVSQNLAGEFVFQKASSDIRARVLISPANSGYTTPVLSSLRVSFIPTARFKEVIKHVPGAPIFESVDIVSTSSVRYSFSPGSADTTRFKIILCNSVEVASSTSERCCVDVADTGLTDQSEARTLEEYNLEPGIQYCGREIIGLNQYGSGKTTPIPCFTLGKESRTDNPVIISPVQATSTRESVPISDEQAQTCTPPSLVQKDSFRSQEALLLTNFHLMNEGVLVRPLSGIHSHYVFTIVKGEARMMPPSVRRALGIPDSRIERILKEEMDEYRIGKRWTIKDGYPDGTIITFIGESGSFIVSNKTLEHINGEFFLFSDLITEKTITISRKKFEAVMKK